MVLNNVKSIFFRALLLGMAILAVSCNATNVNLQAKLTNSTTAVPTVTLAWNATALAQGYDVEQSTDGSNFTQVQQVTTTSFTSGALTAGTTYYYRIRAFNTAGTSGYTNIVSATP